MFEDPCVLRMHETLAESSGGGVDKGEGIVLIVEIKSQKRNLL